MVSIPRVLTIAFPPLPTISLPLCIGIYIKQFRLFCLPFLFSSFLQRTGTKKCVIDTYSEGGETAFIADKINLIAAVCSRLYNLIDESCIEVIDEFVAGI